MLDKVDLVVKTELSGSFLYPVEGVDYTVAGIGSSTGSITFASPPANGTKVTRYRDTALSARPTIRKTATSWLRFSMRTSTAS